MKRRRFIIVSSVAGFFGALVASLPRARAETDGGGTDSGYLPIDLVPILQAYLDETCPGGIPEEAWVLELAEQAVNELAGDSEALQAFDAAATEAAAAINGGTSVEEALEHMVGQSPQLSAIEQILQGYEGDDDPPSILCWLGFVVVCIIIATRDDEEDDDEE